MKDKIQRAVISNIIYKTEPNGEWLNGFIVGETLHSNNSIFLDLNFKPVEIVDWRERGDFCAKGCFELYNTRNVTESNSFSK